jgi:translation initiation factor 2 beta subunit (eIF-2beta)/eIF-5
MRLLGNEKSLYDMNDVVLNNTIIAPSTPDTSEPEISDADKKAVKTVEDLISAIGKVTIYSENRIKEARKAYNNLTTAQKKLVTNYAVLLDAEQSYEDAKIRYVEDLIDSIGTVSLNSKTAINRARVAYNLLSTASRSEVYNYEKLVSAETLYAKLLSENKNTVNKAETNKSNKTNKTNATTVKNSSIEKTKIAEYVDDLLESINRDSLNGEIFDAIMAYEKLTDVEKLSLNKESLVADLKQMLSEKIHSDQKTGILVSGAEWDVKLVVEDVSDIGRIQSMQDKMENAVLLGLWDISLVKMYGNEYYQPEETVLVKIPLKLLGDYASYEGLVIAHYTDDGQTEYLNCTIMGEYLVFNAIDFSDYAVIGYNDGSAFHDVLNGTDVYNGNAMTWIPWTIAGGCSMALLAVIFLMLKKRNEKR